ncbi:hypothetical protein FRC17_003827 [Serendipita sp. 399]|nr:hypothetical protein FRC17_003827 [Serendipita sp. 399]
MIRLPTSKNKRIAVASVVAVVALVVVTSSTYAAVHAKHKKREITIGEKTNHLTSTYKTFGQGVTSPLKKRGEVGTPAEYAASFVEQELQLSSDGYRVRSSADTDTGNHLWIQRVVNGIPVANEVGNVVLNKDENIVAFGANFHGDDGVRGKIRSPSSTPSLSVEEAIRFAEEALKGKHNDHPPTLMYYVESSGELTLAYSVQVVTPNEDHFYEAYVDAEDGDVIAFNDFVSHAAYKAVSPNAQDLTEDYRVFIDPADTSSSPNGWHTVGGVTSNDTSGNNAVTYLNVAWNTTKQSAPGLIFNYTYDVSLNVTGGPNIDAARTNTFFLSNIIHDINYHYGFTEATFNFQKENFGRGGLENDPIMIQVQNGNGYNNAQFSSTPDGQSGVMSLFVWFLTNPRRDSSLQNDIIAHEQTHGTTNRMTGGGTGRCIQTTESRGLGEGWSDAFAEWMTHKDASVPDFTMAKWVNNSPKGYRTYPYSTDRVINPLKYSNLTSLNAVHAIGEVWANMLHNVYAGLVEQSGWAADSFTNSNSTSGNVVFLRNFMDGLLLQPCNPTFVQARDAWIQADVNRYNGVHRCTIWKAFASRGLGVNAASYVDDFGVPEDCVTAPPSSTVLPTTPEEPSSTSSIFGEPTEVQNSSMVEESTTLPIMPPRC